MAYGLGTTIGPLIGGYIYDNFGQAKPYFFNGGLLVVTALIAFVLLSPHKLANWPHDR